MKTQQTMKEAQQTIRRASREQFFAESGQTYAESGQTYDEWRQEYEGKLCVVCECTSGKPGDGMLHFAQQGPAVNLCPFCATVFPSQMVVERGELPPPEPVLESDTELLGAWRDFAGELVQYECTIATHYRTYKAQLEEVMPKALNRWANGSLFAEGVQQEAVRLLWYVEAFGRILRAIEPAMGHAQMTESYYPGRRTVEAVRAAVERTDVAPVFYLWLSANTISGKRRDENGLTNWHRWGEQVDKE